MSAARPTRADATPPPAGLPVPSASAGCSASSFFAAFPSGPRMERAEQPAEGAQHADRHRPTRTHAQAGRAGRPHTELYRDALHCVYDFLSLKDLAVGPVLCSRGWLSAAISLRARQANVQLVHACLDALLDTPLRRHVSSLACPPLLPLLDPQLLRLRDRMPQLQSLDCAVEVNATATGMPLAFPAQLQSLTVKLTASPPIAAGCSLEAGSALLERLLRDVAVSCPSLCTLEVCVSVHLDLPEGGRVLFPPSTLSPLLALRSTLSSFQLAWCDPAEAVHRDRPMRLQWGQPHIDVFRALLALTKLDARGSKWSEWELELLTADPAPPLLQAVDIRHAILDSRAGSLLARLPALTELRSNFFVGDLSFLSQMLQLRTVDLNCQMVDPALLTSALSCCSRITDLSLNCAAVTDEQLCALLPSLPLLSALSLQRMRVLTSLRFLSATPQLSRSLTCLTLRRCRRLPLVELQHLRSLSSLTRLTLAESFTEPLGSDVRAQLEPASPVLGGRDWPKLTQFHYEPPREQQPAEGVTNEDELLQRVLLAVPSGRR